MKCYLFIGIFALCFAAWACNDEGTKTAGGAASGKDTAALSLVHSGLEFEPLLARADSLQILYYNDPDGDSLRYSRFFRYTATRDTGIIGALVANFRQPVEQWNTVKDCRSEGKIYVLKGEEILKTVYFSTRCDTCCYVYYIKEGAFYYTPLSADLKQQLADNKQLSREP